MTEGDTNSSHPFLEGEIVVRSTQDNTRHSIQRSALQKSEVFDGMFTVCDPSARPALELDESGAHLELLIRLLNGSLAPPTSLGEEEAPECRSRYPKKLFDEATMIPFPMLQVRSCTVSLTNEALGVYALACKLGENDIAADASQFLRPIESYSANEIAALPDARAVHTLVTLQSQRRRALTRLVLSEDVFPHGYGACAAHQDQTLALWDERRKRLSASVDADTDIAWEMDGGRQDVGCATCDLAWGRAVAMLAYKSRKAISRTDQLQ